MAKAFWDTKNPKKKSKKLSSGQKAAAKARAAAAGRPYPNLVDNAAVSRGKVGSVKKEAARRVAKNKD